MDKISLSLINTLVGTGEIVQQGFIAHTTISGSITKKIGGSSYFSGKIPKHIA